MAMEVLEFNHAVLMNNTQGESQLSCPGDAIPDHAHHVIERN